MTDDIKAYHRRQAPEHAAICDVLRGEIDRRLPDAERKLWHGSPVWFLAGNPIVGYHARKDGVRLLFWSGQSFKERGLRKEGSFKAAERRYASVKEVRKGELARWLKDARAIQWDYKNIVKRKGVLVRLKAV